MKNKNKKVTSFNADVELLGLVEDHIKGSLESRSEFINAAIRAYLPGVVAIRSDEDKAFFDKFLDLIEKS